MDGTVNSLLKYLFVSNLQNQKLYSHRGGHRLNLRLFALILKNLIKANIPKEDVKLTA